MADEKKRQQFFIPLSSIKFLNESKSESQSQSDNSGVVTEQAADKDGGVYIARAMAPWVQFGIPTANGNIYSENIMPGILKQLEDGQVLSMYLTHKPFFENANELENMAGKILKITAENGIGWVEFGLVGTKVGQDAKAILDSKAVKGLSLRGWTLRGEPNDLGGDTVEELLLEGIDFTNFPAAFEKPPGIIRLEEIEQNLNNIKKDMEDFKMSDEEKKKLEEMKAKMEADHKAEMEKIQKEFDEKLAESVKATEEAEKSKKEILAKNIVNELCESIKEFPEVAQKNISEMLIHVVEESLDKPFDEIRSNLQSVFSKEKDKLESLKEAFSKKIETIKSEEKKKENEEIIKKMEETKDKVAEKTEDKKAPAIVRQRPFEVFTGEKGVEKMEEAENKVVAQMRGVTVDKVVESCQNPKIQAILAMEDRYSKRVDPSKDFIHALGAKIETDDPNVVSVPNIFSDTTTWTPSIYRMMIKRIFPEMIAMQICDVGPMATPSVIVPFSDYLRNDKHYFGYLDSGALSTFVLDKSGYADELALTYGANLGVYVIVTETVDSGGGNADFYINVTGTDVAGNTVTTTVLIEDEAAVGDIYEIVFDPGVRVKDITNATITSGFTQSAGKGEWAFFAYEELEDKGVVGSRIATARTEVRTETIQASEYMIGAQLDFNVMENLAAVFYENGGSMDAMAHVLDYLAQDLADFIDHKILMGIQAATGICSKTWTLSSVPFGKTEEEYWKTAIYYLNELVQEIKWKSNKTPTWMVVNTMDIARIQKWAETQLFIPNAARMNTFTGNMEIGTIAGCRVLASNNQPYGVITVGTSAGNVIAYKMFIPMMVIGPTYDATTNTNFIARRQRSAFKVLQPQAVGKFVVA